MQSLEAIMNRLIQVRILVRLVCACQVNVLMRLLD